MLIRHRGPPQPVACNVMPSLPVAENFPLGENNIYWMEEDFLRTPSVNPQLPALGIKWI